MTDTIVVHADRSLKVGTPLVEMEGVGKAYGAIRALEGIDLVVNAGEVACVLGDNGAGKSTLIKIISGLHPHTEGTVKVDGAEVHFTSPRQALDHLHGVGGRVLGEEARRLRATGERPRGRGRSGRSAPLR